MPSYLAPWHESTGSEVISWFECVTHDMNDHLEVCDSYRRNKVEIYPTRSQSVENFPRSYRSCMRESWQNFLPIFIKKTVNLQLHDISNEDLCWWTKLFKTINNNKNKIWTTMLDRGKIKLSFYFLHGNLYYQYKIFVTWKDGQRVCSFKSGKL